MVKPTTMMVGAFPPPTHGMAVVNAAVRDRLRASGAEVHVIDVAAPSLSRGVLQRMGRLPRVVRGWWRLLTTRKAVDAVLYMSVSGGLGQVYEMVFLALARLKGMRVVLHHHSFAYIDRPSRLAAWLIRLAGKASTQVVLSEGMGKRLASCYGVRGEVLVMSNAAVLFDEGAERAAPTARDGLHTIGLLSNLSADKGVFDFLDVVEAAAEQGMEIEARLAGPFQDAETEHRVSERLRALPQVMYLGPLYAVEKVRFYQRIDALLFPTRYRNEAEPLVTLEALRAGVPVIAYSRGTIPEYIDHTCGCVVSVNDDYKGAALSTLSRWRAEPEAFREASRMAWRRFQRIRSDASAGWVRLVEILCLDQALQETHAKPRQASGQSSDS